MNLEGDVVMGHEFCADVILNPADHSPYEKWEELAVPPGVNLSDPLAAMVSASQIKSCLLFECVGVPGFAPTGPRGIASQYARGRRRRVHGDRSDRADLRHKKELNLQFVLGYSPEEFAATLHNLAEGRTNVDPLITGKIGVDGVPEAFAELASPERHAKILVEPWR